MRDSRLGGSEEISYIDSLFCGADAAFCEVHESAGKNKGIQVSPVEGKALFVLLRMIGAKFVVEVGSLVGYSSLWIARAIQDGGMVYSIDISPENCVVAQGSHRKAGLGHKITQLTGDAKEQLETLSNTRPFDAIFIDGDKGGYCDYLDWAEKNIRAGGLIIADNVLLFGTVASVVAPKGVSKRSWGAVREFNRRLSDPDKYDAVILPMFDGLMIASKKT